jgi:hypothetical protein
MAVYATSALFKATDWWRGSLWLFCAAYYAVALGLTALLAHLSYRHLESPFLRLKEQRFSLLPSAPSTRAPADLPL